MYSNQEVKMEHDYPYIARSLAGLTGVPVRVYRGGEEVCLFQFVPEAELKV